MPELMKDVEQSYGIGSSGNPHDDPIAFVDQCAMLNKMKDFR